MNDRGAVREWNRRQFLLWAGVATGIALGGGGVITPRRARGADSAREIELIAKEVRWELAPGKAIKAMTYNGQVPGPASRSPWCTKGMREERRRHPSRGSLI